MHLLDLFFPKRCVGCGALGGYFCRTCRARICPVASNESICPMCERPAIGGATHPRCRTRYCLDGLTSFFHYDTAVRKAVKALKYRHVSDLASEFISLVPELSFSTLLRSKPLSPASPSGRSFIIPIPLHVSRLRDRGFNQAEVLGQKLAARLSAQAGLQIPMRIDILTRIRATVPQVAMSHRVDRLKNMQGVFAVQSASAKPLGNAAAMVLDDVFTTGATMRAAANVLKRAGIERVWAVTMAR